MTTSWHSYPKIFSLGHRAIEELFLNPVIIQEKVDGSQFSCGIFDGVFRAKSKGAQIDPDAPPQMFKRVVENMRSLPLHEGWTYRGECLDKPKHNVLCYDRVPSMNMILFDVNDGEESYLSYADVCAEAARLGLEIVPLMYVGEVKDLETIKGFLNKTSVLGGQLIEGVVVKNYARFGEDKKILMGKYVAEAYKEKHSQTFAGRPKVDIVESIIKAYRSQSRWEKAIIHMREGDGLDDSPKDIGPLIAEIQRDVLDECGDEIGRILTRHFWKIIASGIVKGFAEWYKDRVAITQFGGKEDGT